MAHLPIPHGLVTEIKTEAFFIYLSTAYQSYNLDLTATSKSSILMTKPLIKNERHTKNFRTTLGTYFHRLHFFNPQENNQANTNVLSYKKISR